MKVYGLILTLQCIVFVGYSQQLIRGKILTEEDSVPLQGATIIDVKNKRAVLTNESGEFSIKLGNNDDQLEVRYIGYLSKHLTIKFPRQEELLIFLKADLKMLKDVTIVNTGYQNLPKERATGSYVQLSNDALNRKVSPDIISRLADISSGLIFNKNQGTDRNNISIRGRSTLFANDQPLVILNNFPYEGDLDQINPNDVESITILKDASAASIWGARAGNGVIVITTKSGKYNQKPQISFNTILSVSGKTDLFFNRRLSVPDFIEMEKQLFSQGFYEYDELSSSNAPLSPVVELLIAKRDGTIDEAKVDREIEAFKQYDVRSDFEHYLYRRPVNRQYAISLNGGTENNTYFLSFGYDKNLAPQVSNSNDRITINGNSTYNLISKKLDLRTSVYYSKSNNSINNLDVNSITIGNNQIYPYAQLADENGNPNVLTHQYRAGFVNNAIGNGLLDWSYHPLQELALGNNHANNLSYQINTGLKYTVTSGLSADVHYQYSNTNGQNRNLYSSDSYFTRNLINQYTQIASDGTLIRIIPLGEIMDLSNNDTKGNSFRGQVNFNKDWNNKHQLNAIAGYEIRDLVSNSNFNRLYGYDSEHITSKYVDYIGSYINYAAPEYSKIRVPANDKQTRLTDRYISYYFNGSYNYLSRYILSFSGRIDKSNLFGVNTNQKGVPLYSLGGSWNISQEGFYHIEWMPFMKFRTTFGYSGNIDKSLSALTIAQYNNGEGTYNHLPIAVVIGPPNPELRWERVKMINLGLDFSSRGNAFAGSLDLYRKEGLDLIGSTAFPSSTGILNFKGNTANTIVQGMDLNVNYKALDRRLKWNIGLLFSYAKDKVTKYGLKDSPNNYLENGDGNMNPLEGRPLSALYSFQWAGLDPLTGDPQSLLNGVVSKDYDQIVQTATPENIIYHGPARPVIFGSIQNTFNYKGFALFINASYRMGYYFRKTSIQYNEYFYGSGAHGDYYLRWQKQGDEKYTSVPSFPKANDLNRDKVYTYSSLLVERGDHIRLENINLSYTLEKAKINRLPFANVQISLYVNNLGVIWRANKSGIDPDYQNTPLPMMLSAGIKIGL